MERHDYIEMELIDHIPEGRLHKLPSQGHLTLSGDYTSVRFSFAFSGDDKCYRDVTTTTTSELKWPVRGWGRDDALKGCSRNHYLIDRRLRTDAAWECVFLSTETERQESLS
jgi:hypothetical protein